MMGGIKEMLLLCVDNLDFLEMVNNIIMINDLMICITVGYLLKIIIGAVSGQFAPDETSNALTFLLDDVGCNGSESNVLDCQPQHNCGSTTMLYLTENAGVQCLRKGITNSYTYTLARLKILGKENYFYRC